MLKSQTGFIFPQPSLVVDIFTPHHVLLVSLFEWFYAKQNKLCDFNVWQQQQQRIFVDSSLIFTVWSLTAAGAVHLLPVLKQTQTQPSKQIKWTHEKRLVWHVSQCWFFSICFKLLTHTSFLLIGPIQSQLRVCWNIHVILEDCQHLFFCSLFQLHIRNRH